MERFPPAKDILIDPSPSILAVSVFSIHNLGYWKGNSELSQYTYILQMVAYAWY
jgi:hypothetical protein